jgi:hypothetical protein
MLGRLARFDFNGLGYFHGGFRNFSDSSGDEPGKLIVVCRRHAAGNARGCLNKLCLFHSRYPTPFCELKVNYL